MNQGAAAGWSIFVAWIALVSIFAYITPLLIAVGRELDSAFQIAMLNVLTGWSGVGWIVALIWALKPKAPSAA